MGLFEQSVKAASRTILEQVNTKCNDIAWELFTLVVNKTPSPSNPGPKAKGLLSNQWYPSTGSASSNRGTSLSSNGGDSLSRINSFRKGTEFMGKDGKATLANNLDYALQAEDTGWTGNKNTPPYRMVALSLQAVGAKYTNVRI